LILGKKGKSVSLFNRESYRRFQLAALFIFIAALFAISTSAQQSTTSPSAGTDQKQSQPEQSKPAQQSPNLGSDVHKPSLLAPGIDPKTGQPLYLTIQEDWSSLQIGTSKLEPQPPLVAQTDEGDGFIRTLVQLQWRPGDPLDLYVILPKGVKKPPAVLYLYGYLDDTDRFRNNGWCTRATRGGVAAVGFVSALSGSRFQSRPLEQWFVSELQESLGSTVHDVHFILDYLAQRGDIDMDRIGMFGQSSGGAIALLAAAAEPRIKAVDVLDPWGDWPVWLAKSPIVKDDPNHKDFAADPQFLKKVAPLDPVKWLPTLTSTHVRIQQVMDNLATPDACKDAIKKAAPKQAEVVRFDHVNQLATALSGGRLFDWVKDTLKSLPAPAAAVASGGHTEGLAAKQQ
jgi:pimeloyl-ACP methyl ester carboxylesterase